MKNNTNKNLIPLTVAAIVLVGVNMLVGTGVQNGQLSPVDNGMLWGAFVVLNVVSLLWAVSLLGLQPLLLAFSYAAGGFLAYNGVRGMANISIAEVTTAGATYGAIGVLAVGNVTTKVRLAFFHKKQIPFVGVVVALLMMDGILNSRISGAGSTVILNALILPFVLSGVLIGLIWTVITRYGIARKLKSKSTKVVAAASVEHDLEEAIDLESNQLMVQVPETAIPEDEPEEVAAMEGSLDPEPAPAFTNVDEAPDVTLASEEQVDDPQEDHFFPLEIDKDDEFVVPLEEESGLMDLSAYVSEASTGSAEPYEIKSSVEDIPPSYSSVEDIVEIAEEDGIEFIPESELETDIVDLDSKVKPAQEPEEVAVEIPAESNSANDWLSGHLDLINKINTKDQ